MERLGAQNIFEANKVCYFFNRILNFEFVTIEKSRIDGTVKGYTSKWDMLRFVMGFSLMIYVLYDVASESLQLEKRSIIFEMTMSMNGKIQGLHPVIVMLQVFIYRYEYLRIFIILDWIDQKVFNAN